METLSRRGLFGGAACAAACGATLAQAQQRWFHRNLGWFYQVLWLLPVVGASFYLNVSLSPPVSFRPSCVPAGSCERVHDA